MGMVAPRYVFNGKGFSMIFLLAFISLFQTVIGSWTVYAIYQRATYKTPSPWGGGYPLAPPDISLIIFTIVLLIGLGFLVAKLRNFEVYLWLGIVLEVLLSPIATARILVTLICKIAFHASVDHDVYSYDEALDIVIGYLFYIDLDSDGEISAVVNFFTQLLICLPVIAAAAACDYIVVVLGIAQSCNSVSPIAVYFCMLGCTFFPFFYCCVRKQPTEVITGFDRDFVFKNRYTGDKVKTRASGNYYIDATDTAQELGWERVSGGYTSAYTPRYIFTILLSPVLLLTQAVGVIFALIGIFCPHIYSCYGMIDFDSLRCSFLQKVLHFFFSFVII